MLLTELYCFIFCFGTVEQEVIPPPDTFCSVYQRQVLTKSEYEALKPLPKSLRDRMQYNDLYYLCKCKGWGAPECQTTLK